MKDSTYSLHMKLEGEGMLQKIFNIYPVSHKYMYSTCTCVQYMYMYMYTHMHVHETVCKDARMHAYHYYRLFFFFL